MEIFAVVIKIKDIARAAVDHGENVLKVKNNHNSVVKSTYFCHSKSKTC